ncbi:MAG: 3-carboxyethylcatechol 2,3-dioxygenase [Gammaproteobacteria bacterium]|nr:3-carboxyethylcatechol 2,3-dioxygenase [Gammaproteobacteria bacterium]
MRVAAICASHAPLKDIHSPGADTAIEVARVFEEVRAWVRDLAPELVIVFGPDHFNGFFYQLMPSFCIGTAVESIGDWNTPAGTLPVDSAAAEACVKFLHQQGVDIAVSYRMQVDHGLVQTLQMICDWAALPPLLPIFVNCAAPPLPPFARMVALGRAIGTFARDCGRRVLIVGSGGLSHDPPVPALRGAAPEVRERLIVGGPMPATMRAARQARVAEEGLKQLAGTSECVPVNPVWDRHFLDLLLARDFVALSAIEDLALTAAAGRGGHEVRTWVATAAAMSMIPHSQSRLRMYRPIPIWVAGYGVLTIE